VGLAFVRLERIADQCLHHQSSNCDCLASQGLSTLLDLEGATWQARPADRAASGARADPDHEQRKPDMGRSAYSRRAFEARNRHRRDQREQIHGSAEKTALPDLEDLPCEPCEEHGFGRLLHGADDPVSDPICVSLVLAHDRRRILHFAVTAHPTAEWSIQQLRKAFPWDTAPQYLLRDRDRIFGKEFVDQVKAMGIKQVTSAPRSPWQRAYVERVIGTIRRECLDHVIVFNEKSLYRHLRDFVDYYHRSRTHLGLQKDAPGSRPIQHAEAGPIISIPKVGGLHHCYERRAA
jgi:transposase InsO family protein